MKTYNQKQNENQQIRNNNESFHIKFNNSIIALLFLNYLIRKHMHVIVHGGNPQGTPVRIISKV
jgi:hypothetical protein